MPKNRAFIRQPRGYDCGPTALWNACVALNERPPSMASLRRLCRTDRHGTARADMLAALRGGSLPLALLGTGSARDRASVGNMLVDNGLLALVLGYHAGELGHYCVLTKPNPDRPFWTAHNWAPNPVVEHCPYGLLMPSYDFVPDRWVLSTIADRRTEVYLLGPRSLYPPHGRRRKMG